MMSGLRNFGLQLSVRMVAAVTAIVVVWVLTRNLIWTLLFAFLGAEITAMLVAAFVVPWMQRKWDKTQGLNSASKADYDGEGHG